MPQWVRTGAGVIAGRIEHPVSLRGQKELRRGALFRVSRQPTMLDNCWVCNEERAISRIKDFMPKLS